jgi:mannose-6-phosphate isomerase-like protein (cupin superfamily)
MIHRIGNPGTTALIFIEVQLGDRLMESDIERLADHYGR